MTSKDDFKKLSPMSKLETSLVVMNIVHIYVNVSLEFMIQAVNNKGLYIT